MDVESFSLTVEQEFQARAMALTVEEMSEIELRAMTMQLVRLMMVKENIVKNLVRKAILAGI
jgi:Phycobilisome degradation protein nblA